MMDIPVQPIGMIIYFFIGIYLMGSMFAACECDLASCDLKTPWRHILFFPIGFIEPIRFTFLGILCQIFSIAFLIISFVSLSFNLSNDKLTLYSFIACGVLVFHIVQFVFLKIYHHFKNKPRDDNTEKLAGEENENGFMQEPFDNKDGFMETDSQTKLNARKRKSSISSNSFVLYRPRFLVNVTIVCAIISIILTKAFIRGFRNLGGMWMSLVTSMFLMLSLLVICYCIYLLRCKIKVVNDTIYVTPLVGKVKAATFSEIEKIEVSSVKTIVYAGHSKLFVLDGLWVNDVLMYQRLGSENIPCEFKL